MGKFGVRCFWLALAALLTAAVHAATPTARPETVGLSAVRLERVTDLMQGHIEAGTFAVAAAITGGEVTLRGAPSGHLGAFLDVLAAVGVDVSGADDRITVRGAEPGSGYRNGDKTAKYYNGCL